MPQRLAKLMLLGSELRREEVIARGEVGRAQALLGKDNAISDV